MKRKLIALSIGTATMLSINPVFAGGAKNGVSAPTIYGRLDIAQTRQDEEGNDAYWDVQSYASRLGVKGKLNTNSDDLSVIYKYELELNPTEDETNSSDDSDFLKARSQYVGLKSDQMGTLRLGRMDTPLKKVQGKVDIFGDHEGDLKYILEGDNREGDSLNYESPTLAGFKLQAALIAGEENDSGNFDADADGIADGKSVSITYSGENFYVGIARDDEVDKHDLTRVAGTIKLGDLGLGALYQTGEKSDGSEDHDGFIVSGYYKLGDTKLKLQYGQAEDEPTAGTATEYDLLALGVDYSLAKPTTVYGEYITRNTEVGATDSDYKVFAVGIRHKF